LAAAAAAAAAAACIPSPTRATPAAPTLIQFILLPPVELETFDWRSLKCHYSIGAGQKSSGSKGGAWATTTQPNWVPN